MSARGRGRDTKYNHTWKDEDDGTNNEKIGKWFYSLNNYQVKCKLCNKKFSIANKGLHAIKRHASQITHKKKSEKEKAKDSAPQEATNSGPSTSRDDSAATNSGPSSSLRNDDVSPENSSSIVTEKATLEKDILFAEGTWAATIAEHNISFLTSQHFSKNIPKMFHDSAIAAGFKCGKTKSNYIITDGISLDIQEKLQESLQNVPYSIMIDESNKQYGKKFLVVMVKFYDASRSNISTRFLDITECNQGSSDDITQHVVDVINKNNLSFDNLIQVMSDNPNVMRGIHTGVVKQITSKYASHLVDIGGCTLHHVSNAVKNSLPEPFNCEKIEELLQDASVFFKRHVQFAEKYEKIQEILNVEKHKILRYCEVRFLSVYIVVDRLIEQFSPFKYLFLNEIPKHHKEILQQPRVVRIITALKDKFTLPTLYFIKHALEIFQKYEKLFQRTDTTIHLLYDKQIDLFRTTLIYFCRLDEIEKCSFNNELLAFDYEKAANILPLKDFSIGRNTKRLVEKFSEDEAKMFLQAIKRFFTNICHQLKKIYH